MVQYHVNLSAQRMASHTDVSSSLFTFMDQPLGLICQPRCHHLDSIRGRGKCGEERDFAVWKVKVACGASTRGFKPVPLTIQSPAVAAAEAERPEQETLYVHKPLHHHFWLGCCHCSSLRPGWRVGSAHMGHTDCQSHLPPQAGNEAPATQKQS